MGRLGGCKRKEVKVEELKKPEKREEYQERLERIYDRVKESVAGEMEDEWTLMKENVREHASSVCGKRIVGDCRRKGSEWWNEEVKRKVEEKKKAFEEWLQKDNVLSYERYKEKKVEVKRKVREAKRTADFRWGQELGKSFEENKKKFWKEMKRSRKGATRSE